MRLELGKRFTRINCRRPVLLQITADLDNESSEIHMLELKTHGSQICSKSDGAVSIKIRMSIAELDDLVRKLMEHGLVTALADQVIRPLFPAKK